MPDVNSLGQQIGVSLTGWRPPPAPARESMAGGFCTLEPLDIQAHSAALFAANADDVQHRNWTYLPYGPFSGFSDYTKWMESECLGADPLFFAILPKEAGVPLGLASFMRITPAGGSIELGHIHYSPRLQGTTAASEAIYLMLEKVFALGYRRCEWKCDALNHPSRTAAERFGFTFEGLFRQATVYKNRNRDTAWFSMLDCEWDRTRLGYQRWMSPDNFDRNGHQRSRLSTSIRNARLERQDGSSIEF